MTALITATHICQSYILGKKTIDVLHGIELEIFCGEKVFLCGPSGAGKTTLLSILAGLESPKQGEVFLDSHNFYALSSSQQARLRNSHMAYIFQNYYLLPELTATENVLIPALIGKREAREAAKEALGLVGLSHRLDHLPSELSGGEQQRVAIARALINQPKIIFADEPTGNLDSRNGQQVMELLFSISDKTNATLVIVTHDEKLAMSGSRIIGLKDGHLVG